MEPSRSSAPSSRHWHISIPVSLGVVLLLTSLVIAAVSLRSRVGNPTPLTPGTQTPTPAESARWMSLGYVDIEGGVTPLYPLQQGRVKSIEAVENEPIEANKPLFHLDDTMQALKVREAEIGIRDAEKQLAIAEAKAKQLERTLAAQREAIAAARVEVERAKILRDKQKGFSPEVAVPAELKNAEILVKKAEIGVRAEEAKLAALEAGKPEAETSIQRAKIGIEYKNILLKEAQKAQEECVVRAPSNGTPLRILVSVGETLGAHPQQPAVQFATDRPLLVRAEVDQEFVDHVRKSQTVGILDHVTNQECGQGRVVGIARWYAHRRSASPQSIALGNDVRTLECLIKIDSTSREVRIGQRVRVQFPD